ncbi:MULTISPECIES: AEC family transporter [unclassified Lonepinella]|uniref:AEC family transporter n=1 Tax=unclassified Lonepinella TaxID=2642006 RepID=UPI0036DDA8AB
MDQFISSFLFSLNVTLPIILLLLLGMWLRRSQVVDERFCDQATKVIFNITLPLMLFFSVYGKDIDYFSQIKLISVGIAGTVFLFLIGEFLASRFVLEKRERSSLVQSFYRGNNGILGLAFCVNAYGQQALTPASIYSAALIFVYNILAVITLTRSLSNEKVNALQMMQRVGKNPLIIAIAVGFLANTVHLQLPKPLATTGHYLADITLPFALICAGASINFRGLNNTSKVATWGSLGRLLVSPLLMLSLAQLAGLNGINMGIVLLMAITPLASAAYTMTKAMGGNGTTVANIIGITTVGSLLVSSLVLMWLKQSGFI